ncbi:bifunctional Delta(1)-pyrroline-2-carboxylate/Delta(1)-piperideine-2-carboxylate reductase [Paraburkholderia azotifigens]|uniref:Bifunctional Delta(1)-pyrroline-2-carboxylate/Delta(1)-piperideine-2-carboxylate reductase n=1 Tax=Paraburkholderia azotifigens TaxID=2057004 RepID=A0A5C6VJ49_9BURK|nr:bifunctional Delta(1)-pyrroline-2-carboxylate/Delta(1)-piperideine-2-carboxylate reductase [Paraburkholderia azotifigens]TXC84684.1 delta(1)-pyrroline-2-carboxylate reductase family protein [Paraburkholderia azotifigens]
MDKISVFDAAATAALLDFIPLVDALAEASVEHDRGEIHSPVRVGVPLNDNGVVLSMPASAPDVAIHKLVSVSPDNAKQNLPTIFGTVTVCNGQTGRPEFILDGPTVTSRRTAALSMLGVRVLHPSTPQVFLIIGTGQQAQTHALAIHALYPTARVLVKGLNNSFEDTFCGTLASQGVHVEPCGDGIPDDVDTVITVTTSKVPVYAEAAKAPRLVIGVGAFTPDAAEIAQETVRASRIFVDDLNATRAEAGDLIQADVDWSQVRTLGSAVGENVRKDAPIVLKTVGSGAWDLAACRVARAALK